MIEFPYYIAVVALTLISSSVGMQTLAYMIPVLMKALARAQDELDLDLPADEFGQLQVSSFGTYWPMFECFHVDKVVVNTCTSAKFNYLCPYFMDDWKPLIFYVHAKFQILHRSLCLCLIPFS